MKNIFSFENGMPHEISATNSTVSITNEHSRDGESSLEWRFEKGASITFNTVIPFNFLNMESANKAIDSFVMWVHCPYALNGELLIEFFKNDNACCSFVMRMGYTGWRTAWVAYERDMQGVPQCDMSGFRITANTEANGILHLDQIIVLAKIDSRNHTPDYHLPFVHDKVNSEANNHWLSLLKFMHQQTNCIDSAQDTANTTDIATVTRRLEEYILKTSSNVNESEVYDKIELLGLGEGTKRRIDIMHVREAYPKSEFDKLTRLTNAIEFREVGKIMYGLASLWHNGSQMRKDSAKLCFIRLFKHLQYLGYASKSALGTTHHSGYQIREFMYALFLMRQPLLSEGLCQAAGDLASWYCGTGRALGDAKAIRIESLDTFNTLSHGMLIGALLQEKSTAVHALLKGFQRWLNSCLLPAPGLEGPFKSDNCMFHHCNHYPAYALGGIESIAPFIYFISNTSYKINEKAHSSVKNAVLAFRVYCNTAEWSIGMSSRHPDGSNSIYSGIHSLAAFRYLAMAGNPDGSEAIDKELAAACMRLYPYITEKDNAPFEIAPEKAPNGHWSFNYGCCAVHRREEWMLTVRGYSRYIWGNESYVSANLYGRYVAYGQLEQLNRGNPINHEQSGYSQFGWNWNFWPGTTAIELPFHLLRSDVRNVDTYSGFEEMIISDQAFCGGARLEDNGVFAINLHEHAKYNGTHRARKSYFFINEYVVCLGSNIENKSQYETYTTIYQKAFVNGEKIVIGNVQKDAIPFKSMQMFESAQIITDNKNNRYFVPSKQKIKIEILQQTTPNHENDELCTGVFAKALICHGISPSNAEYEYAVLVSDSINSQKFAENVPYTVLQKNCQLHALMADNTIYQVFFEPANAVKESCIVNVDTPCLAIEAKTQKGITLAICDPDMRFYKGVETDQFNEDGSQKEVSLYSRIWQANESAEHTISLTLKGKWLLENLGESNTVISYSGNETTLKQVCCEAKTYKFFITRELI